MIDLDGMIDPDGGRVVAGLYRRIADELRAQITAGEYRPGERLPTEPRLMEQYDVSRNTVRLAVSQLVHEGLVRRVAGRDGGMVVRERVTLTYHASRAEQADGLRSESDGYFSETRQQGHEPSQDFELRLISLPDSIAERLGEPTGATAVLRRCLRSVNDDPTSIQDTYYPMALAEEVRELLSPSDVAQGTTRLLAERGHLQVAFRDEIEARMPSPEETSLLRLSAGTPVIKYVRTAYTTDHAVRVTVTTFAGDRNRIVYTLGQTSLIPDLER
jgi:GntR family transcriptional regulator